MLEFSVPLKVKKSKNKYFTLNLNEYRNAHYRVLSNSKSAFTDIIKKMHLKDTLRKTYDNPVRVHYTYYPATNRAYDRMNVASIIDKYLMDALVTVGVIRDDNYRLVLFPTFEHGGVDRENPRCEVVIEEVAFYSSSLYPDAPSINGNAGQPEYV